MRFLNKIFAEAVNLTPHATGEWYLKIKTNGEIVKAVAVQETDPTVGGHIKNITAGQISNWDQAFSWGNHANAGYQTVLSNPITGTGTTNYLSKFTPAGTISDSTIFDNGTNVGIGTSNPSYEMHLKKAGTARYFVETTSTNSLAYHGATAGNSGIQLASFGTGYASPWTGKSGIYVSSQMTDTTFNIWRGNQVLLNTTAGGFLSIGATIATEKLDVDGKLRLRNILNATGDFLNASATGVIQKRTAAEVRGDIGAIGGIGTSYVFVSANGTDVENAAELQAAYNLAKTKVQLIQELSTNLIDDMFYGWSQGIYSGYNSWNYWDMLANPVSTGLQNVEIVADGVTMTIEIDVINSSDFDLFFSYSGSQLNNITSFKYLITEVKRVVVIASPMYYNFSSDFIMDEEYIDLISLDGNRSIVFNGVGTINIIGNNVFVKGVDVLDKNFNIATDLILLKVENCKGGDNSFGGSGYSSNEPSPLTVNGNFTNCEGGEWSFGGCANQGGIISGKFVNCKGGSASFGGGQGIASGEFIDCIGSSSSFGSIEASGIFTNCEGNFGQIGNASGTFRNCKGINGPFGKIASGLFFNCTGEGSSFAVNGIASGTFINCVGGLTSFGSSSYFLYPGTASGTFVYCIGGEFSFGGTGNSVLTGKLYYCRLTSGNFKTVSGGGITRLCINGNNVQNNQG